MQIFKTLISLSLFLLILVGTATGVAHDPRGDGAKVRIISEKENKLNDKDSFEGSADVEGHRIDSSEAKSIEIGAEETSDEDSYAFSDLEKDSSATGIMLLSRFKSEGDEDRILVYGDTMDNDPKYSDFVFHVNDSTADSDPGALAILGIGLFGFFAVIRWRIK